MESVPSKESESEHADYRCVVCGTPLLADSLCCGSCARHGLDSMQHAAFFWDEA
jgi:hypothetical protein